MAQDEHIVVPNEGSYSRMGPKSTLPVGSCRHIANQLPEGGLALVYNPEFFREGLAIQDFFQPSKIVLGSSSLTSYFLQHDSSVVYPSLRCKDCIGIEALCQMPGIIRLLHSTYGINACAGAEGCL